jgi:lysophospholipase L1-like esterase
MRAFVLACCLTLVQLSWAQDSHPASQAEPRLPKVVLIGDSIRMAYAPEVARLVEGKAIIVSAKANGGDSANLLKNLTVWAIAEKPDIVHFNCGIHDTKKDKQSGKFQVPPEQYEKNLRAIVERLRQETSAKVVFATTTPIIDDRAAAKREKATYELLDTSVVEYNSIATRVMRDLKVPVNDLRSVIGDGEQRGQLMSDDGVHFTAAGTKKLAQAVADMISQQLAEAKQD